MTPYLSTKQTTASHVIARQRDQAVTSRYFQLKSGHAAIGVYLHQIKAQEDATCRDCGLSRETIHHLLFECRKWRHQRNKLYKDLEMDGVMRPAGAEEHPQGRLLGESRATRALLKFWLVLVWLYPEHILSERRKGPEETMNGDWKHWKRRLEQEKDSREGSLS